MPILSGSLSSYYSQIENKIKKWKSDPLRDHWVHVSSFELSYYSLELLRALRIKRIEYLLKKI